MHTALRVAAVVVFMLIATVVALSAMGNHLTDISIPFPFPFPSPQAQQPFTHYANDELGIYASLPGSNWGQLRSIESPEATGDSRTTTDHHLTFTAMRANNYAPKTDIEMRLAVQALTRDFLPPVTTTDADFHGYRAIRMEGVQLQGNDRYHSIYYFFIPGQQLYIVGAGALVSEWDSSGKADVESLLDSVFIRQDN